jgi:hypothetical protein
MTSTKFKINSNEQNSNSKLKNFGHLKLVLGIYLACLREAASAKVGIWNLCFEI